MSASGHKLTSNPRLIPDREQAMPWFEAMASILDHAQEYERFRNPGLAQWEKHDHAKRIQAIASKMHDIARGRGAAW